MSRRELFFRTMAVGSLGAALYHAFAAVGILRGDATPVWRHALFVVIDGAGAWAIVHRPRWLVFPAAVLTVQQCTSHGSHALRRWQADGTIDWVSVVLLVGLTTTVALLWQERQERA